MPKAKPVDSRESLIARAEQQNPGISDLMKLYESAESAYRSAVSGASVRVATSTNAT